ncbi:GTPase HflX [Oxynema aestuarii AP17]|uniref:GTPase HflX n=1 Tax=Oxynema aestuarii AP17 TaxID=2064643 RepID=A0A6H1TYD8_9CYAN|nr:GTPase HflX [Oxynema aestuarii]QIZ71601.1 GTPase HflX [Oxynema aestuarii AP17]RMH75565.1 MAG: GTPase HflX [Cyanobacteria bacterium J007]
MPIETIYGNLQGLKPSQLKQLKRLYHQRLPVDCIATPEFSQRLAAISTDIGESVCAYLNRRGQVIRVGVGTPRQTQIPPLELPRYGVGRLSGIRCLSTQVKAEGPNQESLTAMAIQRLDALVVLTLTGEGFERRGGGATGYVRETYLAYLTPQATGKAGEDGQAEELAIANWHVSGPMSLDLLAKQDFLNLVEGLEAEFERQFIAREVDGRSDCALLVGVMTAEIDPEQFEDGLAELARLVDTAGGKVLGTIAQKRSRLHPQTAIGAGKVQELALSAQTLGANLIVFDRDLSPAQVRNLETQIGVRVVDRTEVILDIFAQRAQSGAGKLQVELAQLEYTLPRLTGRGEAMSRLGGGIGTRGPGETKLETERRAISRRIAQLQKQVDRLQAHRSRMRLQRQKQAVPSIAIVGYTNAGKSTLLNTLTSAEIYTADQLFATLDPTTRRCFVPDAQTGDRLAIVLTDTVGFIHELPPSLMDAFRATLEEVSEADALLHVVDLSHPAWQSHIQSVRQILKELPVTPGPSLIVFNKIDCVSSEALAIAREEFPLAAFISARAGLGLETLRQRIGQLVDYAIARE